MYVVIHSLTQVILATNIAESSITVPDIKYGEISAKLENLLVPKKDFQLFQPKEVEKVLVAVGASACCVSLSLCVCAVFSGGFLHGEAAADRPGDRVRPTGHHVGLQGCPQTEEGEGGASLCRPLLPSHQERVL